MPGCVFHDPVRNAPCMAPIANWKLKMCSQHAARGRGMDNRPDGYLGKRNRHGPDDGKKYPRGLLKWLNPPPTWRTTWCSLIQQGKHCRYGHTCAYAHTKQQLRNIDDPMPSLVFQPKPGETEEAPTMEEIEKFQKGSDKKETTAATMTAEETVVAHPLWNVEPSKIEPELCIICCEDGKFADRRWVPCGHMMCNDCMINWRQQSIQKKTNGTSCHVCRQIITGSEVLPKAEKANGPKNVKSVWANPDARAAVATRFVGSTLTIEEERAQEAAARRKLKEEAEQRERQEQKQKLEEEEMKKQRELQKAAELKSQMESNLRAEEQRLKEKLLKQKMEEESRNKQKEIEREKEAQRIREEIALRKRESREREEAMETARRTQQANLSMFPQVPPALSTSSQTTSSTLPSSPNLISMIQNMGIGDNLTDFQRKQIEKIVSLSKPPPPGFNRPSNPVFQGVPYQQNEMFPPVSHHANEHSNGKSTNNNNIAPTIPPTAVSNEDSEDELTEEEKVKKQEKRKAKLAQRKAKEEALAKANDKAKLKTKEHSADEIEVDFGKISRREYEQAKEAANKLEQERQDMLLAQKLAASFGDPTPPVPVPKPQNGKWNCHLCTFENEPLYPQCAMCMTPRSPATE